MRALFVALLLTAVSTAATAAPNLPPNVQNPTAAMPKHDHHRLDYRDDKETLKNIPSEETPQQKRRARKACLEAVKDNSEATDCKL